MWYIIIVLIVIAIIMSIFERLADLVGGSGILLTIIFVFIIAFFAFSWVGVFTMMGVGIFAKFCSNIHKTISNHDAAKKEIAQINRETLLDKEMHENELNLLNELNENCRCLGYMDETKWKAKLPNYINKKYNTSFAEITRKFALQTKEQNIRQNDDWFQPFLMYAIEHIQGATVTKMLNEVSCPQFNVTHVTSEGDLLNTRLTKGTERISKDVPPLFNKAFIKDMNENLFIPTEYAIKLYGKSAHLENGINREEISFDDL